MNPEEPYRDQAERLRRRIEKITEKTEPGDQMPPRGQLHRQRSKKTKWKIKYPVIRLLVLLFILLPITCFSIISYYHGKKINVSEKVSVTNSGYETINLAKENNSNNTEEKKIQVENKGKVEKTKATLSIIQQPKKTDTSVKSSNKQPNSAAVQASKPAAVQASKPVEREKYVYHVVQPKENLFRISLKYYHSKSGIEIIKKANGIWNDQISTGQVLKIPLNN